MENLKNEFKSISSHESLNRFINKYSLQQQESNSTFIINTYTGIVDGNQIFISHRWYDRCKMHVIQEDGNEISIEIKSSSGASIFQSNVKYVQD